MAQLINPDLPSYWLPSCDPIIVTARPMTTRGRLLTMQRLLPELAPQVAPKWQPGMFRTNVAPIQMPTKAGTEWECRTVEDVLRMRAFMRCEAMAFGYSAVEAVYPPGCEWLSLLANMEPPAC